MNYRGLKKRISLLIQLLAFKKKTSIWILVLNAQMLTSKIYILRYLFKTLWFPLLSFYSQLIDVLRLLIGSYKPILPRKNFVILFPGQPRLLVLNFPLLFILSRLGICYISVEKQDVRSALSIYPIFS